MIKLNNCDNLIECTRCRKKFPENEITVFWNEKLCEDCKQSYIEQYYNEYMSEFVDIHKYDFILSFYVHSLSLNELFYLFNSAYEAKDNLNKRIMIRNYCNQNNMWYYPYLLRRLKGDDK